MRVLPILAALATLAPTLVAAAEVDELVLLRGDVSYEVLDAREDDQRGDGNLGWFKVYTAAPGAYELAAEGPKAFSMSGTLGGVLTAAADELGLFVRPSRAAAPPHLQLHVDDYWCEDSRDWVACHARLRGLVTKADGTAEGFEVEESVDGGLDELHPLLQEALLLELSGLPSAGELMFATPPGDSEVLRYGWLTRADGTMVHGVVAEDSNGGLCVVRSGISTPVALEDLVDVDVRDVRMLGVQERSRWVVAMFEDGRHIGGAVIVRPEDQDGTWVRTPAGVYRLPRENGAEVTEGRWTATPPTCAEQRAATGTTETRTTELGSWDTPRKERERHSRTAPRGATGKLALVDRSGDPLGSQDFWDDRLYAVDAGFVGERRWKRYRLSWQSFADKTRDPTVQLALDDYVADQTRRAHIGKAIFGIGVGSAIASGVLMGVLGTLALEDTNLLLDPGHTTATALAGGGLGAGIGFAIGGVTGSKIAEKRTRKLTRYQDLLIVLTLEEAERAVERFNDGQKGSEPD